MTNFAKYIDDQNISLLIFAKWIKYERRDKSSKFGKFSNYSRIIIKVWQVFQRLKNQIEDLLAVTLRKLQLKGSELDFSGTESVENLDLLIFLPTATYFLGARLSLFKGTMKQ